jgi:hypothetical protein
MWFRPGFFALLAKFIPALTADMMTALVFFNKVFTLLAFDQIETLPHETCLKILAFALMLL